MARAEQWLPLYRAWALEFTTLTPGPVHYQAPVDICNDKPSSTRSEISAYAPGLWCPRASADFKAADHIGDNAENCPERRC